MNNFEMSRLNSYLIIFQAIEAFQIINRNLIYLLEEKSVVFSWKVTNIEA